ncbi:MAG: hypothetical protein NW226_25910 [Microscillaceae bacterium]|nr:hypothetical protein [Microscillaceae bacterium]
MKKLLIVFVLATFLLSSCSSYYNANQVWIPNNHKKQDLTKPPKTKKRK